MENNENKIALKTIALKDLWNVFRGCWIFVLSAAIVVTVGMYAYAKMNYSPRYSSTAALYFISENTGEDEDGYTVNEFASEYTLAFRVVDDSQYLLKSRTVLNKVGEEIGIKNGYGALYSNIKIENPESTRVLEITATAGSPEKAKQIVDGVCRIGAESINEVLRYNQLHVFEEGTLNNSPVNYVSLFGYAKFGVIAALAIYIVFLGMFLFDNYIHNEQDIERYLGLSILGDIPDADAPNKKKSKYSNYKSNNIYGGKSVYGGKE